MAEKGTLSLQPTTTKDFEKASVSCFTYCSPWELQNFGSCETGVGVSLWSRLITLHIYFVQVEVL